MHETIFPATPSSETLGVWDHPILGGKVTICVLLYGTEHYELHRRCLGSIVASVPPERMDLRIGCNSVGPRTAQLLGSLPVTKVYDKGGNVLKYPRMREMLYDLERPITTRWLVWFDDDTHVVNHEWFTMLGGAIVRTSSARPIGCYGQKAIHPLYPPWSASGSDPKQWFQNSPCYRGKPFQAWNGSVAERGWFIHFPVGGWWCAGLDAIRAASLPEPRIVHWGGDIAMGFGLAQAGYEIASWNERGQYCKTSDAAPRGESVPGDSVEKLRRLPWYQ